MYTYAIKMCLALSIITSSSRWPVAADVADTTGALAADANVVAWDPAKQDMAPYLQHAAEALELYNDSEPTFFKYADMFDRDLFVVRARYAVLKNAPGISECARLPPAELVMEFISDNANYQLGLQERLKFDTVHAVELDCALREAKQLEALWRLVGDIQKPNYLLTARRQGLAELRAQLGARNFYTGNLPAHLPTWRLESYVAPQRPRAAPESPVAPLRAKKRPQRP